MGDVEDPYLYASQPIYEWQQTDMGKWCMDHLVGEGTFICEPDPECWGFNVIIAGDLEEKDYIYFKLKYHDRNKK